MRHRSILIVLIMVGGVIGAVAAIEPVAAQDSGGGIEIRTNATDQNPETYAQEVDPGTRIVSWEYDEDREGFVLLFETDRSTSITLTEAVQFSEGTGSGRIYRERIPEGTTEIFVSVPKRGGNAALTMVTPASLEQNSYSYVSTGETTPDKPAITYERVQLLVSGTAIGAGGLVFGLVRKRRNDEEKEVERIL